MTLHHGSGTQGAPGIRKPVNRKSPTEYLESLGVVGPNVVLAHCLGLDEAEIDCMARTRTAVVMCPVTAAKSGRGVPEHGRMPELLAKGVKIALGLRLAEQLQPPRHGPRDEHGGDPVQGRPPGPAHDSRRVRARDGHAGGRAGARRRRPARLHRARQAGGPGAVRHRAAGVAGALQSRQQPGLQRRRRAACTRSSWTAASSWRTTASRSPTRRSSSARCRRSASGSRRGPASPSPARAGRSSDCLDPPGCAATVLLDGGEPIDKRRCGSAESPPHRRTRRRRCRGGVRPGGG